MAIPPLPTTTMQGDTTSHNSPSKPYPPTSSCHHNCWPIKSIVYFRHHLRTQKHLILGCYRKRIPRPAMAFSRFSIVCLLLLALIDAHIVESRLAAAQTGNGRSLLAPIDCGSACDARCRLSSRSNLCKRACGTCCDRCNCVPPGTSGNEDVCPCYANMTTRGGKHKCP